MNAELVGVHDFIKTVEAQAADAARPLTLTRSEWLRLRALLVFAEDAARPRSGQGFDIEVMCARCGHNRHTPTGVCRDYQCQCLSWTGQ